MARTSYKPDKHNWKVVFPLGWTIKVAVDGDEAKQIVLQEHGYGAKPYLARDWPEPTIATPEEIKLFAVWADNVRPSQPTWKTVKNPRKPTQERLV